jgi:hypothetical protein
VGPLVVLAVSRSRDGSLRFGAGSHCGEPISEVSSDYIESLLRKVPDLPEDVRITLRSLAA